MVLIRVDFPKPVWPVHMLALNIVEEILAALHLPTQMTLNWKPRFKSLRSIWFVMLSKPTWLLGMTGFCWLLMTLAAAMAQDRWIECNLQLSLSTTVYAGGQELGSRSTLVLRLVANAKSLGKGASAAWGEEPLGRLIELQSALSSLDARPRLPL